MQHLVSVASTRSNKSQERRRNGPIGNLKSGISSVMQTQRVAKISQPYPSLIIRDKSP
jgi:hypothetical protein